MSTGLTTDHRGILVFTMPEGEPETEKLGTMDLTAFNPEGRIAVLVLPDGRTMTRSGPIIDFIEDSLPEGAGAADGEQAEARIDPGVRP
ncbi:MAG: hypothetical protein GY778_13385 [bacterium]|nr:hypothetical protein [bacterium]